MTTAEMGDDTPSDLLGLRNMSTASASSFINYTMSLAARGAEEDFYRDWQIAELFPGKTSNH